METNMDATCNKAIKCTRHCAGRDVYCFIVRAVCPWCGKDTGTSQSMIPPFLVPSPLCSTHETPMSIVVRPTRGTFASEYSQACDLHIGLTSSLGVVYEFDENGAHVGSPHWRECVSVAMTNHGSSTAQSTYRLSCSAQSWDSALFNYFTQHESSNKRYSEEDFNCFDFVIGFLAHVDHNRVLLNLESKAAFSNAWILPSFRKAVNYVTVYRHIEQFGYYLHDYSCTQHIY